MLIIKLTVLRHVLPHLLSQVGQVLPLRLLVMLFLVLPIVHVEQSIMLVKLCLVPLVVLVKRRGTMLIPNGDMILREGDTVLLYTKSYISGAVSVEI